VPDEDETDGARKLLKMENSQVAVWNVADRSYKAAKVGNNEVSRIGYYESKTKRELSMAGLQRSLRREIKDRRLVHISSAQTIDSELFPLWSGTSCVLFSELST
jgi:hypothetical protein